MSETIGALSVGDIPLYRRVYAPLLAEALFAPSPDAWLCEPGESPAQRAARAAEGLRELLERHAGEVCALILEPLVQCAGGMRMHDPQYLRRARALWSTAPLPLAAAAMLGLSCDPPGAIRDGEEVEKALRTVVRKRRGDQQWGPGREDGD